MSTGKQPEQPTAADVAIDAAVKQATRGVTTFKEVVDFSTKQGFLMVFACVILWKVLLPLAEKHGEFVDKTGDAVASIAESMGEIKDSNKTTATATLQNAEVIKEMQKHDGNAEITSAEHLEITRRINARVEEIGVDVKDVKSVVVKPSPSGTSKPK